MHAQAQHAGFGSILKLLLTLGIFAALISVFGPLLREGPSPGSYEWGHEPSPQASPGGVPAGQEAGAENAGEGPLFEAAPRPSGVPQAEGPVEAGTSSPSGIPSGEVYDCSVTGVQLAQVSLASIKAFMDRAYQDFVRAEQTGDAARAWEKRQAYTTSKTDLEKKKWRCFNCADEIGCNEDMGGPR